MLYNPHQVKPDSSEPPEIVSTLLEVLRLHQRGVTAVASPTGEMSDFHLSLLPAMGTKRNCTPNLQIVKPSASTGIASTDQEILDLGAAILEKRMRYGETFTDPKTVSEYLKRKLAFREREVFVCLFLDSKHRLIAYEELFFGTISGATVHPREVVKQSLFHNAAAVIVSHNHPSLVAEPSGADISITTSMRDALALVEVTLLDHIIVAGNGSVSLAEMGEV